MNRAHVVGVAALLCVVMGVGTAARPAAAADKGFDPEMSEKQAGAAIVPAATANVYEVEPNDACPGQAVDCGDVITASLTAGDVDLFHFSVPAYTYGYWACLSILTEGIPGQAADTDTRIDLLQWGIECSTVLASDDDSGPGLFSWIANFPAQPGEYVVRVRHLMDTGTGPYQLTISCNPEPPANAICAGATPIACGTFTHQGTTFCAGNDLNLPAGPTGCTGFSSAGQDVVYSMDVNAGAILTADYTMSDGDGSIYILTDCANVGSCVAGSDKLLARSPETLTYTFPAGGTYYLVLDSFGTGSAGHFTLSGNLDCSSVPVQPTTWGLLKARYIDN